MEKILVSACLIGKRVRYDGKLLPFNSRELESWQMQGRLIPCCPEVAGGLPVPRPPCEIQVGESRDVLGGEASIVGINGQDVTAEFVSGARSTLELAEKHNIRYAILKDGSPSCGSTYVYDGSFTGVRVAGTGVTTAMLMANRILVLSEHDVQKLIWYLK